MSKLERLVGTADPQGRGLEIGALDAPLTRKPRHDVRYVDYAPTEVIKANQFDPSVQIDEIVEVDLVWGAAPLAELAGGKVDYVVASHVIEHVPDLIGWLGEMADVLRPGGLLGLAIPDKRCTFDALRKESVLAEAVEAWLVGSRQPSLRQVFDAASLGVGVDAGQVWAGAFDPAARREEVLERLPRALTLVRRLRQAPRYNDAHCWVFTPESFLDLAEELAVIERFPFEVAAFYPTEPGAAEFMARLVRTEGDAAAVRRSIADARRTLSHARFGPEPQPEPLVAPLEDVTRLQAHVEALQRSLEEMRASTSWRITAPLRALRRPRFRGPAA